MSKKLLIILALFTLSSCSTIEKYKKQIFGKNTEKNKNNKQQVVFDEIMSKIHENYAYDIDNDAINNGIARGMVSALDENAEFFTLEDYNKFNNNFQGNFTGLGIGVAKHADGAIIQNVLEDSPAMKANIEPGDIILSIDGYNIDDVDIKEIVHILSGKPGEKVVLDIISKSDNRRKIIRIIRNIVPIKSVKVVNQDSAIPIIRINFFSSTTFGQVKTAIQSLNTSKMLGLVIDLRNNPGGSLDSVVDISSLFLKTNSVITHLKYKNEQKSVTIFSNGSLFIQKIAKKPIIILVDEKSASASELLAAALRENGKCILIGSKTFGKGTVQDVIPLNSIKGAGIKMTVAQYLTPKGNIIHKKGIEPDYICKTEEKCDIMELAETNIRKYY